MSSVCIPASLNTIGSNLWPIANQNLSFHHFPVCAVCNRFVEEFKQIERFDLLATIFMAYCHGRAEGHTITREEALADSGAFFKLISRPWFMADYEKLKAAQPKVEPPKVPSLLDKPTRQIDLE